MQKEKEELITIGFRVPKKVKEALELYAKREGYTTISYFLRHFVEEEILSPEFTQLKSDFLADIGFALALLLKETLPKEKVKLYAPLIGRLLEGAVRLNMQNLATQIKEEIGS